MRVLVTGGNGFIGHRVIANLVDKGVEVWSLDIVPPTIKHPGVRYFIGTVLDEFLLRRVMRGCQVVIHMAALMGVRRTDKDPLICMNVNVVGTQRVLEAALHNGVEHVMLTSSSEVLGDIKQCMNEHAQPAPKSVYGVSKLAAEEYVKSYAAKYGVGYTIVRFFNVYGPGQVADYVLPKFVLAVRRGEALRVNGDGSQVRSFCYVDDAARAVTDLTLRNDGRNELFHIGNDKEPISMLALARTVKDVTGLEVPIEMVDFDGADRHKDREVYWRTPDVSKLSAFIGYRPKIGLRRGIELVFDANDIVEVRPDSEIPRAGYLE